VVPARPAAAQALRRLHTELMARLLDPAATWQDETALRQVRDTLLIEWIEVIPERVDASSLPSVAARRQLVNRACELMLAQPDEPLSMLELCGRVGASRRKLNYCFQDVLGTSPMQYLRAVRLNGVRRELRNGAAQAVQDAAARWGFFHMGQFSTDYKKQFGELPSATLRAGRRLADRHGGGRQAELPAVAGPEQLGGVRLGLAVDGEKTLPAKALLRVGEGRRGGHGLDEHVPILEEAGPLLAQRVALFVHLEPLAVAHGQAAPVNGHLPAPPRAGSSPPP
jgi:AraC-like DNA-binding protein